MIHILCELRTSHGITVDKLRGAEWPIRLLITPAARLRILDEIYRVRQDEVDFLEGKIGKCHVSRDHVGCLEVSPFSADGQAPVWICRTNLPESDGATNHNEQNMEISGFDAVSAKMSNSGPACAEPGSRAMDTPAALFAPVAKFSASSSPNHHHFVQGQTTVVYQAGLDTQILPDSGRTVLVSTPLQAQKCKQKSEKIAHVDTASPVVLAQNFYPLNYCSFPSFDDRYGLQQQPIAVDATPTLFPGLLHTRGRLSTQRMEESFGFP